MSKNESGKARFWVGVLYPENMRENWEIEIGDIVQLPYAYCCHTQDRDSKSEHRKDHVHLIIAFTNTTTYSHAMDVFNLLSADGKQALNTIQACVNVRNVYDYLIHDTDTCRKQKKELYPDEARITGNNFDIGAYEQLGTAEKNDMCMELCQAIKDNGFMNFMDFFDYAMNVYGSSYFEIIKTNSGLLERLTRGNYQKWEQGQMLQANDDETQKLDSNTKNNPICCPNCGSVSIKKHGKTALLSQRWLCKDCGKSFVPSI